MKLECYTCGWKKESEPIEECPLCGNCTITEAEPDGINSEDHDDKGDN